MMYEPREDSLILKKYVEKFACGLVLDMGTGSGVQAVTAAKKADRVIAVDVNKKVIEQNKKIKGVTWLCSDLYSKVPKKKFDTIIFNPPYLPEDKCEPKESALITTGGKKGYEILERFLSQTSEFLDADGKVLIVFSSLTKKNKVDEIIDKYGFEAELLYEQKIPYETLYVYLITKSELLKKFDYLEKYAKGKRGVVYKAKYKGKTAAVKVEGVTEAVGRIENEAEWLKKLNKFGIGPKYYFHKDKYVVREFVEGEYLPDYVETAPIAKVKSVIKQVFDQCYTMDTLKVNKEEMHRPVRHVIVDKKPVMIDFERCHITQKPKNVTQFCQFLNTRRFGLKLKERGLKVNKKLIEYAKKYKKSPSKKHFQKIKNELFL